MVVATYPRGAGSVELTIEYAHTEWYDHLQQFHTTYFNEYVDAPASGAQVTLNYGWGSAYCSDWNDYPYPQDEANYKLVIAFAQRTIVMAAPAHVMDYSGSPGYQCS